MRASNCELTERLARGGQRTSECQEGRSDVSSDLLKRTKQFGLDALRLCASLPRSQEYQVIGRQLMRSATSVGANYRAARRARSRAEFVSKLAIVEEEADESLFWIELLEELKPGKDPEVQRLKNEANQLVAIVVTSKKAARGSYGLAK